MANRIIDIPENYAIPGIFGPGAPGFSDEFPNKTRWPDQMANMVQEEIVRAVEPELGLNDPEVSVDDPKYNQLQQLLYGIPSAQAAMDWEPILNFAADSDFYCACTASVYASNPVYGFMPAVAFGAGFRFVTFRYDGGGSDGDVATLEDPRACVDVDFGDKAVVVVGTNGYIFRSTVPVAGTEPISGVTEDLLSVAYDGVATLVACGVGGVCIKSEDSGVTWSNAKPVGSSADDFKKVLFVDGDFLLFQDNFKVYVSSTGDAADWDERGSGLVTTSDACYLPLMNRIVAAGAIGDPGDITYSQDKFLTHSSKAILGMKGAVYSIAANPKSSVILVTGQDSGGRDIAACSIAGEGSWKYFSFRNEGTGFALEPLAKIAFFYGRFFIPGNYEHTRWSKRAWVGL